MLGLICFPVILVFNFFPSFVLPEKALGQHNLLGDTYTSVNISARVSPFFFKTFFFLSLYLAEMGCNSLCAKKKIFSFLHYLTTIFNDVNKPIFFLKFQAV